MAKSCPLHRLLESKNREGDTISQPNIPNISPIINLEPIEVINIILASIGLEELALAHLINAEAEKLQYALGTLETTIPLPAAGLSFDQILQLNRDVNTFLLGVSHKELVLLNKFNETIELFNEVNEQLETQCTCSGSINSASASVVQITVDGQTITSGSGSLTVNGVICPNCNLTASIFTVVFNESNSNTNDFTFEADEFNQPSCLITPTDTGTLIVTGEGNLTFNSTTTRASFSLQLNEVLGNDNFAITITTQTSPPIIIVASDVFADAAIVIENCNGNS